uniref:Uncharacterized protein n=1 Tax=Solanum lycopersicum TaxID=4081 RepID=K4C031_SOLLC
MSPRLDLLSFSHLGIFGAFRSGIDSLHT